MLAMWLRLMIGLEKEYLINYYYLIVEWLIIRPNNKSTLSGRIRFGYRSKKKSLFSRKKLPIACLCLEILLKKIKIVLRLSPASRTMLSLVRNFIRK